MAASANETERLAGDIKFLNKWTIIGGIYGLTSALTYNFLCRRPVIAGFHKHIIAAAIGMYFGNKLGIWEDRKFAERSFVMQQYRESNPQLFEEDEPKKNKYLFEKMVPEHKR